MTEIVAAHLERVAREWLTASNGERFYVSPDGNWLIWETRSPTAADEAHRGLAAALAACAREALIQGRNQGIAHCLQIVQNSRSTDEHVNWLLKKLADTMGEALERAVEEKG